MVPVLLQRAHSPFPLCIQAHLASHALATCHLPSCPSALSCHLAEKCCLQAAQRAQPGQGLTWAERQAILPETAHPPGMERHGELVCVLGRKKNMFELVLGMKEKNDHAVGWRAILASVNEQVRCSVLRWKPKSIVVGSETGCGPCQGELCQGRRLHVVLHQRLLDHLHQWLLEEAEPSREQLHSQDSLLWSVNPAYARNADPQQRHHLLHFFKGSNSPCLYLSGRCGGIKAGRRPVRSCNGKLGDRSWIVQCTEVVPTYGKLITLAPAACRSLNK